MTASHAQLDANLVDPNLLRPLLGFQPVDIFLTARKAGIPYRNQKLYPPSCSKGLGGEDKLRQWILINGIPRRNELSVEDRLKLEVFARQLPMELTLYKRAKEEGTLMGYTYEIMDLFETDTLHWMVKSYDKKSEHVSLSYNGSVYNLGNASDDSEPVTLLEELRVRLRDDPGRLNLRTIKDFFNTQLALQIWMACSSRLHAPVSIPGSFSTDHWKSKSDPGSKSSLYCNSNGPKRCA
jgi:hypothetical protein